MGWGMVHSSFGFRGGRDWDPDALLTRGAVVAPFRLHEQTRQSLVDDAQELAFRQRQPVTETGVAQNFAGYDQFDRAAPFGRCLFIDCARGTTGALWVLLGQRFRFNDLALQRYPASTPDQAYAISPHRDHKVCTGLVAVWLLDGESQFHICSDRAGTDAVLIDAEPGELVLMRGYRYHDREDRPFHFVGRLQRERITFGLRQTGGAVLPQ